MRFCDFITMLYNRFPCTSQERFIREIFSALCGDTEPITNNKNDDTRYEYSAALPEGFRKTDGTYRKRMYGNHKTYNGLSGRIKTHVIENKNSNAFLAYCESVVSSAEFPKLTQDFGISDVSDRLAVYYGLFWQFIEFCNSPTDDVPCVVSIGVAEYKKRTSSLDVPKLTPLHPGDSFSIAGSADPKVKYGFYKDFEYAWCIINSGTYEWNERAMTPINLSPVELVSITKIPPLKPGERASVSVKLHSGGDERGSPYITEWEIRDSEGHNCFPNLSPIRLTIEVSRNL